MSAVRRMTLLLLMVFTGQLRAEDPAKDEISFTRLPETDRLVIFFESAGCFTYSAAEFIYNPAGNGSFEVVDVIHDGFSGRNPRYRRSPLGAVTLEPGKKQKLDAMLQRYRNPPPLAEDTVILTGPPIPRFTIQQRRGFKVMKLEHLSSMFPEEKDPALLTFSEMYGALAHAKRS